LIGASTPSTPYFEPFLMPTLSSAVDFGTNSYCPWSPVDGDGNNSATCDAGAYEFGGGGGPPPVPPTPSPTPTPGNSPIPSSVSSAVVNDPAEQVELQTTSTALVTGGCGRVFSGGGEWGFFLIFTLIVVHSFGRRFPR